jgi:hypothetical protein
LKAPDNDTDIEVWGPQGQAPACVRYTTGLAAGSGSSTFVVTDWDHDCDGFIDRECTANVGMLAPSYDDCLPLAYCGSDTATGMGGCTAPGPGSCFVAAEEVTEGCDVGVCSNNPGPDQLAPITCIPDDLTADEALCVLLDECQCMTPDDCALVGCNLSVDECAAVLSTPDIECQVPVDANNIMCPPVDGSGSGSGSDDIVLSLDDLEDDSLTEASLFSVASGSSTDINNVNVTFAGPWEITLARRGTSSTAGELTDLRVMLAIPNDFSTAYPGLSIVIDIQPSAAGCGTAPTCELAVHDGSGYHGCKLDHTGLN